MNSNRDHLILSKGHGVMAMYAAQEKLGWLDRKDLENYFADGSRLHGLCESKIPGCEVTSGSLGHGLPIATGIAFGHQRRGLDHKVYCIVGDGEMDEGTMWESLLFAGQHKLTNLTIIVDANGFQAMGETEKILSLEPLKAKFESFGFTAIECDGHSLSVLHNAFVAPHLGQPRAIIARTIKGKGISFMENDNSWHYLRLTDVLLEQALKELET